MSEPAVTSAADTAASPPDFASFEAAENAKALGNEPPAPPADEKPAAEPDAPTAPQLDAQPAPDAAPDKSYTPPKAGSRRSEKDQEFINERIRTAVQEATAATEARIRAELAKAAPAPAAEPVAAEAKAPIGDPKDPEPQEADFDDWRLYNAALTRWNVRQVKREEAAEASEAHQREAATAAEREADERFKTWADRRDTFTAAHPTRAAQLSAFVGSLHGGTPIGDTIIDSEVGAEVADYLAAHPDEVARIGALKPLSQIRELGKLETLFSPTTSASASAGPAAKTVTTAPAPPTTLASRSADLADPVAAAVARGDYLAFEAEENRRAVAGSR